jgi:amphi-Trp domain-containing protein
MTKMKFKRQERVTRSEAADRLTQLAEALRNSAKFDLERGGEKIERELDISEDVLLEFEVEFKDGAADLEVEIKWPSMMSSAPRAGSASGC